MSLLLSVLLFSVILCLTLDLGKVEICTDVQQLSVVNRECCAWFAIPKLHIKHNVKSFAHWAKVSACARTDFLITGLGISRSFAELCNIILNCCFYLFCFVQRELFSIWVGSLAPAVTYATLHELFSRWSTTVWSPLMPLSMFFIFPGDIEGFSS